MLPLIIIVAALAASFVLSLVAGKVMSTADSMQAQQYAIDWDAQPWDDEAIETLLESA